MFGSGLGHGVIVFIDDVARQADPRRFRRIGAGASHVLLYCRYGHRAFSGLGSWYAGHCAKRRLAMQSEAHPGYLMQEETRRVARELHDGCVLVGSALFALDMRAAGL